MSASQATEPKVIKHRNVFTGEIVEETIERKKRPKPKPQPVLKKRYAYGSNDLAEWFSLNKPETLADVEDLRLALKRRKSVGKYTVWVIYTEHTSKRLVRVTGPKSEVVIVSQKSRAAFNRKLRNREIALELGYQ